MRLLAVALTVLLAGLASLYGADGAVRRLCDSGTGLVAREGLTTVLARPTSDSVKAPLHHFDWYDWAGNSPTPEAAPADSTWGQVFEAIDAFGPDSLSTELRGREFVAVPWTYDAACHPGLWDSSVVWVGQEPQVFFLARSRRGRTDAGPVFDVLGWHSPYPRASLLRFETDEPRDRWLNATEYFEFLEMIQSSPDPASRLRVIDRWRETRPHARGFPISTLRTQYGSWLRGREP